jgi:PAS domain S-box-containing protein
MVVVGIPMLGLLAAGTAGVWMGRQQIADQRRVEQALKVRTDIQNVLTFLLDAETGVRGYALTGRPSFLKPFRRCRRTLSFDLTQLRDLVAPDPELSQLMQQVEEEAGLQFLILNALRTLGPVHRTEGEARQDRLLDRGQVHMGALRKLLGQMRDREDGLFASAQAREERAKNLTYGAVGASILFGLLGGVAATVGFTRGVATRVKRLGENAVRLATGAPLAPLPESRDEIGRLDGALHEAESLLADRTRELRESEEKFRLLAENADDIIYRSVLLPEPRMEYISPSVTRILGYTPEEFYSNPQLMSEVVHPDDRRATEARGDVPPPSSETQSLRLIRKDGEVVEIELRSSVVLDADGNAAAMQGIARDVTERKRAEDALRESEALKTLILSSMAEGTVVTDPSGAIVSINAAMERMAGWTDEEARGRAFSDVYELLEEGREPQPWEDTVLHRAIEAREPVATRGYQQSLLTRDGRHLPVGVTASPLIDSAGTLLGGLAVVRDVGYEREVDHLKSSLVSTVSHELRTPLTMIQGFSELLMDRDLSDPRSKEGLHQIRNASERLSRLIEDLLSVSRIESGRLVANVAPVELGPVIAEVVAPFRAERPIEVALDGVSKVVADRDKLVQILTNLVSNAVKYSPQGTDIGIGARDDGRVVLVEVRDRGIGMTEDERARLFEKFFRADRSEVKEVRGTGLGLYITRSLVEMQGGRIWVESEPGQGSTFTFSLPAADPEDEAAS